tara:strand:- start:660 stop:1082 length:423 start_codon:yes stop_codon:yes gene_type:complete
MRINNFLSYFFFVIFFFNYANSEIIILSKCENKKDVFLKNEYILNLEKLTMVRNYIYTEKTFLKYKITDLNVKKSNSYISNIYVENGKIFTHKHGYPQFYTQILIEKYKPEIFFRTVLNEEEGISKIATCKKIEKFKKES